MAFLGRQMTRAGMSARLDDAIQGVRAALEEFMLGTGTADGMLAAARRLQAVCTSYAVTG